MKYIELVNLLLLFVENTKKIQHISFDNKATKNLKKLLPICCVVFFSLKGYTLSKEGKPTLKLAALITKALQHA